MIIRAVKDKIKSSFSTMNVYVIGEKDPINLGISTGKAFVVLGKAPSLDENTLSILISAYFQAGSQYLLEEFIEYSLYNALNSVDLTVQNFDKSVTYTTKMFFSGKSSNILYTTDSNWIYCSRVLEVPELQN